MAEQTLESLFQSKVPTFDLSKRKNPLFQRMAPKTTKLCYNLLQGSRLIPDEGSLLWDYSSLPSGGWLNIIFNQCSGITFSENLEEVVSKIKKDSRVKKLRYTGDLVHLPSEAFKDCYFLEKVELPDFLKTIGESAFENCFSLKTFSLTPHLQFLEEGAFRRCSSLENLEIPSLNQLAPVSESVFEGSSLAPKTVFVGWNGTDSDYCSVSHAQDTKLEQAIVTNDAAVLKSGAFEGCTNLKKVSLPAGLLQVRDDALNGCTSLESFGFLERGVSLGNRVFKGCKNLKKVHCCSEVSNFGAESFRDCENLEEVEIAEGPVMAYGSLFQGCKKLKKVKLGDTLLQFREGKTFCDCSGLEDLEMVRAPQFIAEDSFEGK